MRDIHQLCYETAEEFGACGNYVVGARIAGSSRGQGMVALGLVERASPDSVTARPGSHADSAEVARDCRFPWAGGAGGVPRRELERMCQLQA
jgi:hypothetical protein